VVSKAARGGRQEAALQGPRTDGDGGYFTGHFCNFRWTIFDDWADTLDSGLDRRHAFYFLAPSRKPANMQHSAGVQCAQHHPVRRLSHTSPHRMVRQKSKKNSIMAPRLEQGSPSLQQSSGCVTAAHRTRCKLQPDPRTDQRYDRLPTASRMGEESVIPTYLASSEQVGSGRCHHITVRTSDASRSSYTRRTGRWTSDR
jgi:hypothetical protein